MSGASSRFARAVAAADDSSGPESPTSARLVYVSRPAASVVATPSGMLLSTASSRLLPAVVERLSNPLLQRFRLTAGELLLHHAVPADGRRPDVRNFAQFAAFQRWARRHLKQLLFDIGHRPHHAIEQHGAGHHAARRPEKAPAAQIAARGERSSTGSPGRMPNRSVPRYFVRQPSADSDTRESPRRSSFAYSTRTISPHRSVIAPLSVAGLPHSSRLEWARILAGRRTIAQ